MDRLPAAFYEEVIPLLSWDSVHKTIEIDRDISQFGTLAVDRRFRCIVHQIGNRMIHVKNYLGESGFVEKLATDKYDCAKGYGSLKVGVSLSSQNQTVLPELIQTILQKQYFVREFLLGLYCHNLSKGNLAIMAQWNVTDFVIVDRLTEDGANFLKTFQLRNQIRSFWVSGYNFTNFSNVFLPFMKEFQFTTMSIDGPITMPFFEKIFDFWKLENNAEEMRGKIALLDWSNTESINEYFRRAADSRGLVYCWISVTHPNGQCQIKMSLISGKQHIRFL
ncbi:hypothetical protein L596_025466 [Steinernema carpocapsae]|uniref:F-box domain-containing protein n=1 Tax=Steinernema carpocapsae TaxID=34508 RepID=A0A4U5M810_STECR|nr:hypothetical protein L596_025466 [Steinernema carpocapsae]